MLTGLRNAGFAKPARTQTPRLAPLTDPAARTPTTPIVRSANAKTKRAERLRKLLDRDAPGSRAGAAQITSQPPMVLTTVTPHAPGPAGVTPRMRTAIATTAAAAGVKPVCLDAIANPRTKSSPTTRSPRAPSPALKPGDATGPACPTPTPTPPPQQQQSPPQRGARSVAPSPAAAREYPSYTADGWKGPGGATDPARPTPTPTPPPQQRQPPPPRGARSVAYAPAAAHEDPSYTANGWKGLSMFHGKFAKRFTAREVRCARAHLVEEEDVRFHQPSV